MRLVGASLVCRCRDVRVEGVDAFDFSILNNPGRARGWKGREGGNQLSKNESHSI